MSEGKDKTFEVVGKTIEAVDALTAAVKYSEHAWHWAKLKDYAEALFRRAPFAVGDRVRLTKTPNINEKDSWGWMAYRHLLVQGAEGEVASVDFREDSFTALVRIDNQTWLDDGVPKPVSNPGVFHFWEGSIERVPCTTSALPPVGGKTEP